MAPKVCFLGAVRRRTMICCRNVKISASSAARDRNRSTTAQTMSLKRSLITEQHRPILDQPPVNRFATGTTLVELAFELRDDLLGIGCLVWYRRHLFSSSCPVRSGKMPEPP